MAKVKVYCRRTNPRLWWHFVMWYLEWNSNDLDETEWTESKVYDFIEEELAEYLGYYSNGKPNRSMIARFENGHAKINPRVALSIYGYFEKVEGVK